MRSNFVNNNDRSAIASIGAHANHAKHSSVQLTAKARSVFMGRFEREVDPSGDLTEAERHRRAGHAKSAYFRKLALRSAQIRRNS